MLSLLFFLMLLQAGYAAVDFFIDDYLASGENDPLLLDTEPGNFGETGVLLFRVDRADIPLSGCDSSGKGQIFCPVMTKV